AHFSEPKIQYLGLPSLSDKNICWLHVAMDDAFRVRCIQRVRNLRPEIQHLVRFQSRSLDAMLQGFALKHLHGDESFAFFFADVVNSADVGMIQSRRRLRLSPETTQGLRIARYLVGQKLQRHETMETSVLGLVDHAHPAATKFFDDAIV